MQWVSLEKISPSLLLLPLIDDERDLASENALPVLFARVKYFQLSVPLSNKEPVHLPLLLFRFKVNCGTTFSVRIRVWITSHF